jgi:5-formyltetrahydrofolate cyclo-ligase
MDIRSQKNELRNYFSKKRQTIPPSEKRALDDDIAKRFVAMNAFKSSNQILLYASTDDEISTSYIFDYALECGKKCFFPKCYEHSEMIFYSVKDSSDLIMDAFNIKAPKYEDDPYSPMPSDIIIVPAMAYDKNGFRLGYGKGFYDRFLSGFLGTKIGLSYSDFIVDSLPRGRYDLSVDIIVTEKRYICL